MTYSDTIHELSTILGPGSTLYFVFFIFLGFISSFILAPIMIDILYKFKIEQQGKEELEQLNIKRKIGTPVMGGFIIMIPLVIFSFLFKLQTRVGLSLFIIIFAGTLLGFVNDYLDLKGKNKFNRVYSKVNPFIYYNFWTWTIYRYITWPIKVITTIVGDISSYSSGLPAGTKFLLQFGISLLSLYILHIIKPLNHIWIPLYGDVSVSPSILIPFYATVMVAFSNAFCITDGMDAISPGNHIIAFLAIAILSITLGYRYIAAFSLFIIGAELTFYYFNVPPARVEMSDVGTIPIGLFFGLILVYINRVLVGPFLGLIFFIEVLSSLLQGVWAKMFKKKLFKIAPIHHHFEALGWSREKIVMRSYFIQALGSLFGIILALITLFK